MFPNPSPLDAPLTRPAISTNVIAAFIVFVDFDGDNDSDIIDCMMNIVENQGLLGYSKINSTNEVELAWCDITVIPSRVVVMKSWEFQQDI